MRVWILLALFFTAVAQASEGSWNSQSFGGVLTHGKQVLTSKPVRAPSPLPANALVHRLSWKISTASVPPPGFEIKVCSNIRCLSLPGLAGEIALPAGFPAAGPYYFKYYVATRGSLAAPLILLNNQVTVSYNLKAR